MGEAELVFIDANIFLEVLLQDKKNEECKKFLSRVVSGEVQAITSDFIVYTCMIQLEQKNTLKSMSEMVLFMNECAGLRVIRPSVQEINKAIMIAEKYKLDFDDAFVVACMLHSNITTLISLDKDFDKVPLIKRKEP